MPNYNSGHQKDRATIGFDGSEHLHAIGFFDVCDCMEANVSPHLHGLLRVFYYYVNSVVRKSITSKTQGTNSKYRNGRPDKNYSFPNQFTDPKVRTVCWNRPTICENGFVMFEISTFRRNTTLNKWQQSLPAASTI